jgi:hypothetical protein
MTSFYLAALLGLGLHELAAAMQLPRPTKINQATQIDSNACPEPYIIRLTSKRLRIGPNWTVERPCIFRWRAVLRFSNYYDIDIEAADSTSSSRAFISIQSSGRIRVGTTTPAALVFNAQADFETHQQFPYNDALIAEWDYTNGTWNLDGFKYVAPLVAVVEISGGPGIEKWNTPTGEGFELDAFVPFFTNPPVAPGSCLSLGTSAMARDAAGYFYLCAPDGVRGFRWLRFGPMSPVW